MTETWLSVEGYEEAYEVSNRGQIRSLDRELPCGRYPGGYRKISSEVIHGEISRAGYRRVGLWSAGKVRKFTVHSLVARAFIGPRPEGLQVCHNDGNKLNNCVENLRYDTASENIRDSVRHGVQAQVKKTQCSHGHPYDEENTRWVRTKTGWGRQCRVCCRENQRAYMERRRSASL